jgi:Cu(I)/Ag(I) efflux system membrane fusion protein/cobalt-zinc-cadmium efflux system membrane fusion protein
MNKYVIRTSIVWIIVLAAIVAGALIYRARHVHHASENAAAQSPGNVAPAAVGPPAGSENPEPEPPENAQPPLTPVQLTPERMQSIGVTTGTVEFKPISSDIRATGNVDINQRLISYVQIRFPGYIRQVFANAVYQYVRKGEPLFTIYSPQLVAAQQEFLLARQNQKALSTSTVDGVASGAAALTNAALQRLEQWQIPQGELNKLKATGKPITDLTINSPVSGYVTEYNALPNMYVQPSTRLYTVADLSQVWVYAQVFQGDVARLKPGDRARITVDAYPGAVFSGRVDQILPQVDLATRTVRVRLVIANPGLKLKPGMFVNVELKAPMGRALVVPASAVLQSGARQLVFLYQGNGRIEPREVTLGPSTAEGFVVLKGLKAHQRIVTSANFLIDSESQLQAAAGSFVPPPPGAGGVAAMSNAPSPQQATIHFMTNPNPPHQGENTFLVKLTGPKGPPISGAKVTVRFYMPAMPAMGMGAMNTTSTLTDQGNGSYEGTGVLGSGGTWQVSITAEKKGKTIATKQLRVSVAGANR